MTPGGGWQALLAAAGAGYHARVTTRPAPSRALRCLLWLAGMVSLALGVVGMVLPGLPTTVFVLIAAACFARASPRLHHWLRTHRWFGPMVQDWEAHHDMTRRAKAWALGSMVLMVGLSSWTLRERPWVMAAVLAAGAVGVWGVGWRIPTRRSDQA